MDAITNVPGQLVDWGKSKSVLANLFSDLAEAISTFPGDARAA